MKRWHAIVLYVLSLWILAACIAQPPGGDLYLGVRKVEKEIQP